MCIPFLALADFDMFRGFLPPFSRYAASDAVVRPQPGYLLILRFGLEGSSTAHHNSDRRGIEFDWRISVPVLHDFLDNPDVRQWIMTRFGPNHTNFRRRFKVFKLGTPGRPGGGVVYLTLSTVSARHKYNFPCVLSYAAALIT